MSCGKIKLNDGHEMPAIALGTYMGHDDEIENAVRHAIDIGYRHFDTAFFYRNERQVGQAIRDKIAEGKIKREDIFVTTKLWSNFYEPELVTKGCKKSLDNLGLRYIDLFLIHCPVGMRYKGDEDFFPQAEDGSVDTIDVDYVDVWKQMERCIKLGYTKSIGVSNFNSEQIERLLANCEIKPVNNQVECSIMINQRKLIRFCKERDIVVTAYCPLGRPNPANQFPTFLYDPKVVAIGKKYGKTAAQVALRYCVEIGTIPLPKSITPKRIEENYRVFDFKLSDDDMKFLDSLHTGDRVAKFEFVKNHKFYPFNAEF